ncbi:hypothetical protein TrST_g6631 [Triparma strigata]|uniref:Uncharacterized protein n=1 Tax=Triparma strigata TaxID=1606541 RepID=A0A9W7ANU2_9STRA|nr:hypothetical protein TrST_g6631 [Triparma strigata]
MPPSRNPPPPQSIAITFILLLFLFTSPSPIHAGIISDIQALPQIYDESLMVGSLALSNLQKFLPRQSPTRCSSLDYSPAVDYSTDQDLPDELWSWDETDPLGLTELHTGTRFDGISADFEYQDVTTKSAEGNDVTIRYTKTKYPGSGAPNANRVFNLNSIAYQWADESVGIWLEGCLSASQIPTYKNIIDAFADKYDHDGNAANTEGYATIALTLLNDWANVKPDWVLRVYNSHYVMTPEQCQQFSNDGGAGSMAGCSLSSHYNGPSHELDYIPLSEYNVVRRCANCFSQLTSSTGTDVKSNIDLNLFRNTIKYFLPVEQGGSITPMWKTVQSNLLLDCPKVLDISKVLSAPDADDYPEFCVDYLGNVLQHQLVRDGSVLESFNYAYLPMKSSYEMSTSILEFFEEIPDEDQSDNIKASLASFTKKRKLQEEGLAKIYQLSTPDNDECPSNGDNNAYSLDPLHEVTKAERSQIYLGYGHAALRSSTAFTSSQLNFEAYHLGTYQHAPRAVNMIQLTAFGRSVFDNPHYVRNRLRNLNSLTYSWNTVTINRDSQVPTTVDGVNQHVGGLTVSLSPITDPDGEGGDWVVKGGDIVSYFDIDYLDIAVVECDGYRSYYPYTQPGGYSRLSFHNTHDSNHPYTIDVFRVVGGEQHEYVLHGDTQTDQRIKFIKNINNVNSIGGSDPKTDPTCSYGFPEDDPQWFDIFEEKKSASIETPENTFSVEFEADCSEFTGPILRCGSKQPTTRVWGVPHPSIYTNSDSNAELLSGQIPHNLREYEDSRRSGWSGCDMDVLDPNIRHKQGYFAVKHAYNDASSPTPAQTKREGDPLKSLFVHVIEPIQDSNVDADANSIKSIERIPLSDGDNDDSSVALKITKYDDRTDLVVLRLSPGTGGFASPLPLAQPNLPEIKTADESLVLPSGASVLFKTETKDSTVELLIGGDGNVVTGFFNGVGEDNHEFPFYFTAETPITSDDNSKFVGQHVSVALGSYAPSEPCFDQAVQNDVRELYEIGMIDGDKVRLKSGHYLVQDDTDVSIWKETQRPGRWFRGGVLNRSFRIVLPAITSATAENFVWNFDPWEELAQCSTSCGTTSYAIERQVVCFNTVTSEVVGDSNCARSAKPATSRACSKAPDCSNTARYVRFTPVQSSSYCVERWNEIEIFEDGVTPSSTLADETLSNNRIPLVTGAFELDGNTRWRSLDSSIKSRLTGKSDWNSPGQLIDGDLNVGDEVLLKKSVNYDYCDFVVDLDSDTKVGKIRIFSLGKALGNVKVELLNEDEDIIGEAVVADGIVGAAEINFGTSSSYAMSCLKLSKTFGGSISTSTCGNSLQIGVGGSAGSCSRTYATALLFVPLSSALSESTEAVFRAVAGDMSKASDVQIMVWGLGVRDGVADVTDADYYIGPESGGAEGTELLGVLMDGATITEGETLKMGLLSYLQTAQASVTDGSLKYAALRIAGDDDFGCMSACDGGCSLKRAWLSGLSLHVDFTASVDSSTGKTKTSHQSQFVTAECQLDGSIALEYARDASGNVIPDYSLSGYHSGESELPTRDVVATIEPTSDDSDDTARIQSAIDSMPAEGGALLFGEGVFNVATQLNIGKSNVVLRGSGKDKTTILSTSRTNGDVLFSVGTGSSLSEVAGTRQTIQDSYLPVGKTTIRVADASSFQEGDVVRVERSASTEWITSIGMDSIPDCVESEGCNQWEADSYILKWERVIKSVDTDSNSIEIDAPTVHPIQDEFNGGSVYKVAWSGEGRLSEVGFEKIKLQSIYNEGEEESDEDHAWRAIQFEEAENSWVHDVECWGFAQSCVYFGYETKFSTALSVWNYDPVSIITGSRRYSFHINGELNLMKDCHSRGGRHDFVQGSKVAGPNVFSGGRAVNTHNDIGPHMRYATGTLWETWAGGLTRVWDRGNSGSGHGWSGAENVFWNGVCSAENVITGNSGMRIDSPPGARNFGIGIVTDFIEGGGVHESPGLHVFPYSLYEAQLSARLGTSYFECPDLRTQAPTEAPTSAPTKAPTNAPTRSPTDSPTTAPTVATTSSATANGSPTSPPTEYDPHDATIHKSHQSAIASICSPVTSVACVTSILLPALLIILAIATCAYACKRRRSNSIQRDLSIGLGVGKGSIEMNFGNPMSVSKNGLRLDAV